MSAWLPNRCAVCHAASLGARLCTDCIVRYAPARPRCLRCAMAVPASISACGACLRTPPPWSRAVAACDYGYPWDGLLAALKFHAALDLAPALAALLAARVRAAAPPRPDAIVPLPLADARLRERGFDQAALLARPLGRTLGLAVEAGWLLRIVDTPHQLALPRGERAANVRGAFAAEPLALAALRGKRVALVDDVMTTGATLAEASRALLEAGVADVQAWVVARTPD